FGAALVLRAPRLGRLGLRALVERLVLRAEPAELAVERLDDGGILVALRFAVQLAGVLREDVERDRRGAVFERLLVLRDVRGELGDRAEPVSAELLLELRASPGRHG